MLDTTMKAREALSTEKFDFPVAMKPMFIPGADGVLQEVPEDMRRAVVREDTGEVLATVGSKYEITEHKAAFDAVSEALLGSDLDLSRVEVEDGIFEGGARARRSIIVPAHVVQPRVGDRMRFKMDLFNSVDGGWAFRTEFGYFRLVCLNGMVSADFRAGIYARHTSVIDPEALAKQISARLGMMQQDEETFRIWAHRKVSEEAASWFFSETLAKVSRRGLEDDVNKTLHQKLMIAFNRERDHTVYGLWNAMTWWSTHEPIPRGAEHNVRLNRENAVATAMRSAAFDEIVEGRNKIGADVEDAQIIA